MPRAEQSFAYPTTQSRPAPAQQPPHRYQRREERGRPEPVNSGLPAELEEAGGSKTQMHPSPHQFTGYREAVPELRNYPRAELRNLVKRPGLTSHHAADESVPPRELPSSYPRTRSRRPASVVSSSSSRSRASRRDRGSKSKEVLSHRSREHYSPQALGRQRNLVDKPSPSLRSRLGSLLLGQNSVTASHHQPSRDRHHKPRQPYPAHKAPSKQSVSPEANSSRRRRSSFTAPSEMSVASSASGRKSSSSGSNSTVTQGSFARSRKMQPSVVLESHHEDDAEDHLQGHEVRVRRDSNTIVNVFDFLQESSPPQTAQPTEDWSSASSDESDEDEDERDVENRHKSIDLDDDESETPSTVPTSLSSSPAESFKVRAPLAPKSTARVATVVSRPQRPATDREGLSSSSRLPPTHARAITRRRAQQLRARDEEMDQHEHQQPPNAFRIPGQYSSTSSLREHQSQQRLASDELRSGSSTCLSSRSSSTQRLTPDRDLLARKMSALTAGKRGESLVPIYRCFEFLHHRVLQHLQHELISLEEELAYIDRERNEASTKPSAELEYRKSETLGRIYLKMDQYHNALSRYKTMAKDLDQATPNDVATHRRWFTSHAKDLEPHMSRYLDRETDLVKICQSPRGTENVAADPNGVTLANDNISTLVAASIAFSLFLSLISLFGSLSFGTAVILLLYHCGVTLATACIGVAGLREKIRFWTEAATGTHEHQDHGSSAPLPMAPRKLVKQAVQRPSFL